MSTKPTLEFPMEPLTFKVALWSGGRRLGPAELEVNQGEMCLRSKWKSALPPDGEIAVTWQDLRELKNRLSEKQRFVANFGRDDLVLTVIFKDATLENLKPLADIFEKLPPDTFALRCPVCSGAVLNNVCGDCGKSYTSEQRKKGLIRLFAGTGLMGFGIVLTVFSYQSASGAVMVFYGVILTGLYFFITGLIRMLFAVRAS